MILTCQREKPPSYVPRHYSNLATTAVAAAATMFANITNNSNNNNNNNNNNRSISRRMSDINPLTM